MSISFLRTFLLYVTIVIALRLMGKRQIGELEPSELVVTILISELAAIPMQDVTVPLFAGVVPIATLISIEILISFLCLKNHQRNGMAEKTSRFTAAVEILFKISCIFIPPKSLFCAPCRKGDGNGSAFGQTVTASAH